MGRTKIDLPFGSEAEIAELITQFEACTWPYERWTHRAHLALGLCYIRRYPFAEALDRARQSIQNYNRLVGDPQGYNETLTQLFMRKLASANRGAFASQPVFVCVEELARVCTIQWVYRYYSKERVWSNLARSVWVAPDLQALDF